MWPELRVGKSHVTVGCGHARPEYQHLGAESGRSL